MADDGWRPYSEAQPCALPQADQEHGHPRRTDGTGHRVPAMTPPTPLGHGLIQPLWPPIPLTEFGAAQAHPPHDAPDPDDERFARAVDTPGATATACDVPSMELAIVAALRQVGRADHLDDAGKHRITERITALDQRRLSEDQPSRSLPG